MVQGFSGEGFNCRQIFLRNSNETCVAEISENYFVFQLPLAVVPWSEIETKIGGLMCLLSAFYTNSIDLTDGKIKSG